MTGGLVLTGEHGPELICLPRGALITPNPNKHCTDKGEQR